MLSFGIQQVSKGKSVTKSKKLKNRQTTKNKQPLTQSSPPEDLSALKISTCVSNVNASIGDPCANLDVVNSRADNDKQSSSLSGS